jgi:hypothetical protein
MHKKVNEDGVTGEGGGALVEAALVLSLLSMIMFGGWKMIQTITLRAQLLNILSTAGQLIGRDPNTNFTEMASEHDDACSSWDRNNFCKAVRDIVENAKLPLCALSVRITKFSIEDLLNGNRSVLPAALQDVEVVRHPYGDEVALTPLTNSASEVFPDWYSNEVKPEASRDTGFHRQLGKIDITYDYKNRTCGERKPNPQVTTKVRMIFPVYNANEVGRP